MVFSLIQPKLSADGCMSATTIGTIGRHNVYGNSLEGDIAEVRMSSAIEYTSGFTPQYPLPVTNNTEVLYGLQNDYGLNVVTDDSGNGINGTLNGTSWDLGGRTVHNEACFKSSRRITKAKTPAEARVLTTNEKDYLISL